MTDTDEEREPIRGSLEAMTEVIYAWQRYTDAEDVLSRGRWALELNNHMSDLRSYHPDFDIDTGTMPWDREEY